MKFSTKTILACATLLMAGGSFAAGSHEFDAIGMPGVAQDVTRTVNIEMTDAMKFIPAVFMAKQGETIRLVVSNTGQLVHEMVLDTPSELQEHHDAMMKNPGLMHTALTQYQ